MALRDRMSGVNRIVLNEFQEVRASSVGMGPKDLQALDVYSRSLARDGIFQLRPDVIRARHYVGVVVFRNWHIEIHPKILRPGDGSTGTMLRNLLWMLAQTDDTWCSVFDNASLQVGHGSFLELMMRHFAETVMAAIRQGIPQLYVDRIDNLSRPRGRIDFKSSLRDNAWNEARLTCRFSEITYEHILMRAIRFVLRIFYDLAKIPATRQVLSEALQRTSEVPDVPVTFLEIQSVSMPRGNPAFTRAVDLAKLVLQGQRTETTAGNTHGLAIVFDMNRLFERYVVSVMQRNRESLGIGAVQPQKHANLVHTVWDLDLDQRGRVRQALEKLYRYRARNEIRRILCARHQIQDPGRRFEREGQVSRQHTGCVPNSGVSVAAHTSVFGHARRADLSAGSKRRFSAL